MAEKLCFTIDGCQYHAVLQENPLAEWKHLAEVDEECNEMMDRLVRQMAKMRV